MRLCALFLILILGVSVASADSIHPGLRIALDNAEPNETFAALIYLPNQVDMAAMNNHFRAQGTLLSERHETVVRSLQNTAVQTQGPLLNHLANLKAQGEVEDFKNFWIVNAIQVKAKRDALLNLSNRADVQMMYLDYGIESITPIEPKPLRAMGAGRAGSGGTTAGGPEPGLTAIRAPEVWALGITGEGVLVSSLDTGVNGNHPALASRWRGLDPAYAGHPQWAWFDPVTNTTFPQSFGAHGSHTMGTICGGAPGDQVGVAPGAQWIHAGVIDRQSIQRTVSDAILSFQWIIDPDGDPNTDFDVPAVCSNSWRLVTGHGYPPCDETFWQYLDACETAGIVIVFAAGNEGFGGLGRPSDRATNDYQTFSVAAVDGNNPNWPIASFSSRGPTFCTPNGSAAIKPDISGPGVNVRSCNTNGYTTLSGTSMSTPHIAGVVALLRQANPNLAVDEIKQIIYDTAVDLGSSGEDNNYGWGMVDAYEAVQAALAAGGPICASSGTLIEGANQVNDFAATCGSDNVYWAASGATLAFQVTDPVSQFELVSTAPAGFGGTTIGVEIEASKLNNNGALNLRALMFNYNSGSYVALPGTMVLSTSDAVQSFALPNGANPSDFIEPGSNEVKLLLQTIQTSGLANVRTQLDEVLFNFQ